MVLYILIRRGTLELHLGRYTLLYYVVYKFAPHLFPQRLLFIFNPSSTLMARSNLPTSPLLIKPLPSPDSEAANKRGGSTSGLYRYLIMSSAFKSHLCSKYSSSINMLPENIPSSQHKPIAASLMTCAFLHMSVAPILKLIDARLSMIVAGHKLLADILSLAYSAATPNATIVIPILLTLYAVRP